ncbi:MAG TPA: PDGLE domain-containing protein, partial [Desulfurivibrionaceae bacterium]|nr:PDGLE domain-containing protein [Desulfurivibrionaceae bacterium]
IVAISGSGASSAEGAVPSALVDFQQRFSLLPEYNFREVPPSPGSGADSPAAPLATSTAGLVGGVLTLLLAGGVGLVLRVFRHRHRS